MRRLLSGLFVLALIAAQAPVFAEQATAAAPQSGSITDRDLQRLAQALADARTEVNRSRSKDASTSTRLARELDELSDEVAYLRVKVRKEGRAPRSEYFDLRDRIDDLRARASSDTATGSRETATGARRDRETGDRTIPVGTEIDIRLQDGLSSGRNQVEDRFVGTTVVDLQVDERVVIPAGSEVRGVITGVEKAGRVDRKGSLTLAFDRITINGREHDIRGIVTDTIESEGIKGEVAKIGGAAGVGAIIGGILGGVKGAITGVLIGGGGMVAATPGKDVEVEPGAILRVRLDQPPAI